MSGESRASELRRNCLFRRSMRDQGVNSGRAFSRLHSDWRSNAVKAV